MENIHSARLKKFTGVGKIAKQTHLTTVAASSTRNIPENLKMEFQFRERKCHEKKYKEQIKT